jgi:succinate dehydrogenase / fumarate reductase cytochrome b subunit
MAHAESGSAARPRPTSPHLQIYSRKINMVMSILHRITGVALYFGSLLLAGWLIAAAMGPDAFGYANDLFGSLLGRVILLGYTWALIHHMLGGVRHLIWDTGRGLEIKSADLLCWLSIIFSVLITAAIWLLALGAQGGAA